MRDRTIRALLLFSLTFFSLMATQEVQAGYFSIMHSNVDTGANAIALAMPYDATAITITRIRVSSTNTTALDLIFRAAVETTSLGGTKALSGWTCSPPTCGDLFAIDGLKAADLYDLGGLNLNLMESQRFFVYSSTGLGADYLTVEVWWR